ncbi:hypothetical protein C8N35_11731 [Breoghania corrubedonensis]|uniref:Cytoplasmic protein n=1 Tax=Breoghania corrubedonensis TaxID=665038 RepID=A0A2T5UNX4_9HYPH|nr:cytoplasmic protein [Breoghania corrubedonensis]PTW53215.1 hypothetical protein C8N35_11731 [Breoghania corrubedonensis]
MSTQPRLLALAATLMSLLLAPAHAGGLPSTANEPVSRLPMCDAPSVQGAVRHTIARGEPYYRGGIAIENMDLIDETGSARNAPSPVNRRYCRARAYLSNGHQYPVYYMIEEHGGFVGLSWNVEACLPGYDRWHVYDGNCRVVRR